MGVANTKHQMGIGGEVGGVVLGFPSFHTIDSKRILPEFTFTVTKDLSYNVILHTARANIRD